MEYEPITYEDFLPLSAGGIFNSNLSNASQSKQLVANAGPDIDGFQRSLGTQITNEFKLYEQIQQGSLEDCRKRFGIEAVLEVN